MLKVTSQAPSVLMAGDIEKSNEVELINLDTNTLKGDILIMPHHGIQASSTSDFITPVAPRVSIFTNGYLNRFGHPKPTVLERY